MTRVGSGAQISAALVAGFLTAVSLVLPWFTIGDRSRSSFDLLSSASALDVIEGAMKVAVIGGWLLIPVFVAVAMLVAASGRHAAAAVLLVPVVFVTLSAAAIGAVLDPIDLAWGAVFGSAFAAIASAFAIMVLVTSATRP